MNDRVSWQTVAYSVAAGLGSGTLGAALMFKGTTALTSMGVTIGALLICSLPLMWRKQ